MLYKSQRDCFVVFVITPRNDVFVYFADILVVFLTTTFLQQAFLQQLF